MQQSASVYSVADERRARAESASWARFSAPVDAGEMHAAWLTLLADRIGRARAALLLTREAGAAAFGIAAAWPDPQRDLQYLGVVARRVLERREGVVASASGEGPARPDEAAHVGYPIEVGGELQAAVVFDIGPGPLADLEAALRQIHWASAWLMDHVRQRQLAERETALARSQLLNDVLATAMQHSRVQPSALAVANELAGRLACDRVSVGLEEAGRIEPAVMSNTANFDPRSDLVRWLGQAMDEVLDFGVAVSHPASAQDGLGAHAHADSARLLSVAAILSVPVRHEAQTIGVVTFERNTGPPFNPQERELATGIGVMLGPVWAMQRRNERGVFGRALDALREGLHEAAGPGSPGVKLGASLLALFLAFSALWTTDHRVSARTVVEGATQLSAVAPFEGFIAQALVRAGDTVKKGQPLARLDDRDLHLEHSRWTAEREQLSRRFQVAQAQGDRAAMGVLAAQVQQAEAQRALADERIGRAALTSPFDGVVVSGDLSQQIGSPVETGKLLFEIAPLEGYRVMLDVDDRDIARLALRQTGELVLSGLPGLVLPIEVRRITPVAVQRDGRNVFAVEASITRLAPAGLRPGMEGIGKVSVGQRSLLWIWTHGLIDWLRLSLWSWMP